MQNIAKADRQVRRLSRSVVYCLAWGAFFSAPGAWAAIVTNVTVACTDAFCDAGFTPPDVTIQVNDQVKWTWGDAATHSSTSTAIPALWDSGQFTQQGFTFSHTFTTTGNFPYECSFHFFFGSVTVQSAANVPPSISIASPTNGATFTAPWTGAIQANTSDTDGDTVSKVDFFAGTNLLGTVSNPPPSLSLGVSIPAAGNYTLKAVATDNQGATNTSAPVAINIVTPKAITLSSPQKPSATSFQFNYTADPGLSYIIRRSGNLATWVPLATNTAVSSPMPFTDNSATGSFDFYRVQLLPNP